MCKKISTFTIFFAGLTFLSLPFLFPQVHRLVSVRFIFIAYLFFFLLAYFVFLKERRLLLVSKLKLQELSEQKNVLERENARQSDLRRSMKTKIQNFKRLEKFTEDLNHETRLQEIVDFIAQETFDLLGQKGNVLVYLINEKNRRCELRAIKKEIESVKVREKTGDLFDHWVLRHNQPLLVEDAMNDFRFDPDRVRQEVSRPLGSLICLPMTTEVSSLGILRADTPVFDFYHADDLRFFSVVADISKLALENAIYFNHMQELSTTDGVTGIYLRRYALERLKEEFIRAQRNNTPLSFLMFDIDHFKQFNDTFGHMAGDIVLKKVARFLKEFFNFPGSIVARFGGEEFCVVLPHILKSEAIKLAESFRCTLGARQLILRRQKVSVTISIGIAAFPQDVRQQEDLIRCSDDALFKAKREGRNKVCYL